MSDYKNIVQTQDTFEGTSLARMKQPFYPPSMYHQPGPPAAFIFPTPTAYSLPHNASPQPLLGMAPQHPQYSYSPHQQQQQSVVPITQGYSSAPVTPSAVQPVPNHHQPLHIMSSISLEESSSSGTGSMASNSASLPQQPSPPLPKEKEPQIMYWQEFIQLLEANGIGITDRPGAGGCLPDGRFYTPKTSRKDHYFIFNSKGDYIAHFVHYYFSVNNMMRDTTLQNLLEEGGALPVERLLLFPKLSQIETSEENLAAALRDSPKVKIVNLTSGRHAVRRIDGWSPMSSSSSGTASPWVESGSSGAGSTPTSSNVQVTPSLTPTLPPPAPPTPQAATSISSFYGAPSPQQQQVPVSQHTPPQFHQLTANATAYTMHPTPPFFLTADQAGGMYGAPTANLAAAGHPQPNAAAPFHQPMMHPAHNPYIWPDGMFVPPQYNITWQTQNPNP